MFMCLALTTNLRAQDCSKYDLALKACKDYVGALENEARLKEDAIELLKKQNKELTERVGAEERVIPAWAWVLLGAAGGLTLYGIKK